MSESFLSRWSRLKAKPKEPESALPSPAPAAAEPEQQEPLSPPPAAQVPDLPPIDSLHKDSDFSAFLRAGVPEDLRKAALSKLWASDPLFSQPEIYDLHMGDYNQRTLTETVTTAWQFGKGMVDKLDEAVSHEDPKQSAEKVTDDEQDQRSPTKE